MIIGADESPKAERGKAENPSWFIGGRLDSDLILKISGLRSPSPVSPPPGEDMPVDDFLQLENRSANPVAGISMRWRMIPPLLEERAGVRTSVNTNVQVASEILGL
jgi:hypothetical protein